MCGTQCRKRKSLPRSFYCSFIFHTTVNSVRTFAASVAWQCVLCVASVADTAQVYVSFPHALFCQLMFYNSPNVDVGFYALAVHKFFVSFIAV